LAYFDLKERLAIRAERIALPFALLDLVQLQRLTHGLILAGVLNPGPQIVRPH
jgi:hypothetical protein